MTLRRTSLPLLPGVHDPSWTPPQEAVSDAGTQGSWREALPVLDGPGFLLREVAHADVACLHRLFAPTIVSRYITAPPATVPEFARFIDWAHARRRAGSTVCYAIVPHVVGEPAGLIQIRTQGAGFDVAEWGFALGQAYWGSGLFQAAARRVLPFAFETLGVNRLEARASVENPWGNEALRKLGAVHEGILRQAFLRYERYHDQALWVVFAHSAVRR